MGKIEIRENLDSNLATHILANDFEKGIYFVKETLDKYVGCFYL